MADIIPLDSHIHRAPPGHKLVSRLPVMPLPPVEPTVREMIDMEHRKPDYYWGKVNGACERVVGAMKAKLGDRVPDHIIELYGDLIGGPFRLDFETFAEIGKPGEVGKEQNARLQQGLVHNLFYGSTEDADPAFSENVHKVLTMHHDLFEKMHIARSTCLRNFWAGVKGELAVVKVLAENGYDVVLPNYAAEPNDHGMSQDVLDWDVRLGVDLVAAKHGQAYLIDVHGEQAGREHVSIYADRDRATRIHEWERLPSSLKEVISCYSPNRDWRGAIIKIPTSSASLRSFRGLPAGSSAKAELQRFATFTERGLSNDLIQGIMRLQAF